MSQQRTSIASRRRMLQFLAASPLFAHSALAQQLRSSDPADWAPRELDRLIDDPRQALDVFDFRDIGVPLAALGGFQRHNFALAAATAEAFLERPLDQQAVADAAASVMVPGRMEVVAEDPIVIFDGAHNGAGMAALADALPEVIGDRALTAVISILDDKDARAMLGALLPLAQNVVFTKTSNPRALPPGTLVHLAERPDAVTVGDPKRALETARELAGPDGAVLATGSIYLIADLVRAPGEARVSMI